MTVGFGKSDFTNPKTGKFNSLYGIPGSLRFLLDFIFFFLLPGNIILFATEEENRESDPEAGETSFLNFSLFQK